MSTIEEKVLNLKQPAQMYYNQILKAADENIFTAIKDLRKGFAEDSIEPEYREAATLALTAMTAHLNGESKLQPKTDSEALADMQGRIEEARLAGDQELYDSLRAGLAHSVDKAAKAEALLKKRTAAIAASQQAFAEEQASRYETMLTEAKDFEIQKYRSHGLNAAEAESHYEKYRKAELEASVQRFTAYTPPREPIPAE
jgi:hypothetical protein